MAYELRDNSGSLFKNDRKTKDNQPGYKGTVMVNGVEYWIGAWVKEGQKGKFFSLAFDPKEARQDTPVADNAPATAADDLDDEIPF